MFVSDLHLIRLVTKLLDLHDDDVGLPDVATVADTAPVPDLKVSVTRGRYLVMASRLVTLPWVSG